VTEPASDTALILRAAATGERLPMGEFWFEPPLVLVDPMGLSGTHGRTILRPTAPHAGPLITIKTTLPGDYDLGLPKRVVVSDLRIQGLTRRMNVGSDAVTPVYDYGLLIDAAMLRVERVDIINCYIGVVFQWAVDVAFRDCILRRNQTNVYFSPGQGANTITTVRFTGCSIREAYGHGIVMQNGLGVTFDDRTIIEANLGTGLVIEPAPPAVVADVRLRDVWFEANRRDVTDPQRKAMLENCRLP
jgi:hypothetical protein